MAANYIVVNSKFKPFSYSEMLQPVQMATAAHQDLENQYAELATKASIWEEMANEQTDPYAYKMYKKFSNDLEAQAGQLAREGLTPASRQNMMKLRKRYSSDIVPIEQAYNRRQELIDEQRKLLAQDNTLMFDRNASMLSLDDLIANPQLTYQSYSGATLAKQVGTAAQNLAKEMRNNPRKWSEILNGQYFETMMRKGYTPEEVLLAASEDPNAPKELRDIVDDAVKSSNIASWGDQDILDRAYEYARQGLWNAIGDTQYQTLVNYNRKDDNKDRSDGKDASANLYYRPVNKTTVDGDKKTSQMQEDLNFLKEVMNDPSIIDQTEETYIPGYATQYGIMVGGTNATVKPNEERLKEISKRYGFDINISNNNGSYSTNLDKLAQQLVNDISSSAVRSFVYKLNITQGDLMNQVIEQDIRSYHRDSGHTGIYEVKKDGSKGKEVDINDLNSYINSDGSLDYDPDLGLVMTTKDEKGKSKSVVLDTELVDDPRMTVRGFLDNISIALENGEPEAATLFIDGYDDALGNHHMGLMEYLYRKYNTLMKRESNTTSKE